MAQPRDESVPVFDVIHDVNGALSIGSVYFRALVCTPSPLFGKQRDTLVHIGMVSWSPRIAELELSNPRRTDLEAMRVNALVDTTTLRGP